jgi:hypothetical protein
MRGIHSICTRPVAGLLALALFPVSAQAASPIRFAGELSGLVTDTAGRPQPGALVMLFNRQEHLLQRIATDLAGNFSFDDLLPDVYSVRVTLSTFVPAGRDRVAVRPGMRSLLEVNLSKVFSSVQLLSTTPAPGGLMNEDWKWALRADSTLRPILRLLPAIDKPAAPLSDSEKTAVFSGSRGLVRISASDGAQIVGDTGEADLGTQFAFATSVYGGNHVQVSGNVGYAAASGLPAAALRTTYSRDFAGATPAVSVTMRQMYLPTRAGMALTGSPAVDSLPALRTLAFTFGDKTQLSDSLSAEYGFELDTVSFVDRLHYFSPYARLNYALGSNGKIDVTWTSGDARPELGMSASDQNADLQRDLASLSVLPRVTLGNGHAKVQRGEDYELGVSQRFGSREYRVSAYRDIVSNTALTIANPESGLFAGDLVPDLFSNSALFDAGRFEILGYLASVTQDLGEHYKITATYGATGVMELRGALGRGSGLIESADDLRRAIEAGQRPAVTLRASGTVRQTGTRFVTSYQWSDYRSSMPVPLFSTQSARPEPGFNVMIRQPMPRLPGVPWRIEASAELRNLLAQGYLPLSMADGRQLLLVNTPRSIRGGLAFVF